MLIEKFLVHELADRAGTTIRTIRYYTDEGLLPQPELQGKYAYYSREHLDRLELIRRMKEAYLPLREIRQIMLSLSHEDVRQRLTQPETSVKRNEFSPSPAAMAKGANSEALDYISQLMNEQGVHQSKEKTAARLNPQLRSVREAVPPQNTASDTVDAPTASENWEHIQLASGVELHLRQPADPDTAHRIQQLIAFSKKLFRQK